MDFTPEMIRTICRALEKKHIFLDEFVDKGAFGNVYKIKRYKGRSDLCIKIITQADKLRGRIENEFRCMRANYRAMPDKRFAVEVIDLVYFIIPNPQYPNQKLACAGIIMEELIPIKEFKPYSKELIKTVLLDGIFELHVLQTSLFMLHLDLKEQNFCIRRCADGSLHAVLVDFGVCYQLNDHLQTENDIRSCGNNLTKAPEVLLIGDHVEYSARCDIYSLAATVRHMIVGVNELRCPSNPTQKDIYNAKMQLPMLPYLEGYSHSFIDVLNKMMAFDRADRYRTTAEALEAVKRCLSADDSSESPPRQTDDTGILMAETINEIAQPPLTVVAIETGIKIGQEMMDTVTETVNNVLIHSTGHGNIMIFAYSDRAYLVRNAIPINQFTQGEKLTAYGYTDLGTSVCDLLDYLAHFRQLFGYMPEMRVILIGTGDSAEPPLATREQKSFLDQAVEKAKKSAAQFRAGSLKSITLGDGDFRKIGIKKNISVNTPDELAKALSRLIRPGYFTGFNKRKKVI